MGVSSSEETDALRGDGLYDDSEETGSVTLAGSATRETEGI